MDLLKRAIFVVGAIVLSVTALNHFVFGNTGDLLPKNGRMGEWRKAAIREACFPATAYPARDQMNPKAPPREHRILATDVMRAQEMTAALNCYIVTNPDAICEPHNRAYIVDYLGRYFAKKDEMLAIGKKYGASELSNVQEVWGSPNNRNIDRLLAHNIKNGRLNKADFNWSVPATIGPLLDQYKSAADTCPQRVAAK